MPSLRVMPNSFQNVAYFSGSFSASSASRRSTFFTALTRMLSTARLPCRISREMFSGRSDESMTPRMNRRYFGRIWPDVLHDEHPLHMQPDPAPGFGHP